MFRCRSRHRAQKLYQLITKGTAGLLLGRYNIRIILCKQGLNLFRDSELRLASFTHYLSICTTIHIHSLIVLGALPLFREIRKVCQTILRSFWLRDIYRWRREPKDLICFRVTIKVSCCDVTLKSVPRNECRLCTAMKALTSLGR